MIGGVLIAQTFIARLAGQQPITLTLSAISPTAGEQGPQLFTTSATTSVTETARLTLN